MATSGRARVGLATLAVAVLAVAACSPAAPGTGTSSGPAVPSGAPPAATATPPGSPAPSSPGPSSPGPSSTGASGAGPSGAPAPDLEPCRVSLPSRWRSALTKGEVAPAQGEVLTVALGTDDGSVFAVSAVDGVRHTFVRRQAGRETVVQDLGLEHPEWQVLGATFDGRYLAYRVDRSYSGFEDFGLYVWDSQGDGKPVEVAHGEKDSDGELMQTPFVDPVLADGWLYWTQTRDADPGHTVLSGYRLSDGHVERLSQGYGRAPVRFGDLLVWADSTGPGKTSTLRALDLATHQQVAVPEPLAGVRGPYYLAADQDTIAWVSGSQGSQVSVWRPGWAQTLVLATKAKSPQFPRIAGDTVVWTGSDATYAGDLRSWSVAQLTPSYGGVYADGGPVATVGFAPTGKSEVSVQALLDTAAAGPLGREGC